MDKKEKAENSYLCWRGQDWCLRPRADGTLIAETYFGHIFSVNDSTNWIVTRSLGGQTSSIVGIADLMVLVAEGTPIEPYLWEECSTRIRPARGPISGEGS